MYRLITPHVIIGATAVVVQGECLSLLLLLGGILLYYTHYIQAGFTKLSPSGIHHPTTATLDAVLPTIYSNTGPNVLSIYYICPYVNVLYCTKLFIVLV